MSLNLNISTIMLSVGDFFKKFKYLDTYLIIFIIYGLICKLLIALNFSLNSDDVDAGMVSLDIWKHQNYLLESYYFPSADPFWFSDILPFHLIPQIISNFNPMCIRIVCYIIFLMIILIFSILIYKISNNKTQALIFAAFIANLYPESFRFYLIPTGHNATIFFVGLFMILFLRVDYRLNMRLLIYIFLINLIVFSDSIFIAWFIIPFLFCYIILYKNKSLGSNAFIVFTALSVLPIYIYKNYFIDYFITVPIHPINLETIIEVNLPLYIEGLTTLLFGNAYEIKPLNYIYYVIFLILIYYIVVNFHYKNKNIFIYLIISALVVFVGYVCTDLCVNFSTTRYLTFTALSIYLLLALSYRKSNKIYVLLIFVLLSSSALSNLMFVGKLDYQPNRDELVLINYLNNSNLKYGYADYWDSNVITYLSKEKIAVLPVTINSNKLEPRGWLYCEKWFANRISQNSSEDYFILISSSRRPGPAGSIFLKREDINKLIKYIHPQNIRQFGNYTIYEFNGQAPLILNRKLIGRPIALRAYAAMNLIYRSILSHSFPHDPKSS